jgi:spore germination protein GerM
MNRPIVLGILLFLVALGGILLVLHRRAPEGGGPSQQAPAQAPAPGKAAEEPATERRITGLLFFNARDSHQLAAENRYVPYRETLRDQAFEVVKALAHGSDDGLTATIPAGTQVRDLFIAGDGTAYVDFSPEIASRHAGGSLAELNTVYSVVNTLTLNFPQVKRVQILVDDHAVDTLTGHVDLSRPLRQDLSMVAGRPESPAPQDAPQPVPARS